MTHGGGGKREPNEIVFQYFVRVFQYKKRLFEVKGV